MKKLFISILIFLLILNIFSVYSFGSVDINFTGVDKKNYTITLNDELTTQKYFCVYSFCQNSAGYGILGYICSDYEFFVNSSGLDCYDKNAKLYYLESSLMFSSSEYSSFISKLNNLKFSELKETSSYVYGSTLISGKCIYSNFDLKDKNGNIVNKKPFSFPSFANSDEDLSTGNFDYVIINANDFSSFDSPDINFVVRKIINKTTSDNLEYESQEIIYNTVLNEESKYINDLSKNSKYIYSIPQEDIGINFENNGRYIFSLEYSYNGEYITDDHYITIGGLTDLDKQLNSDKITQDKLDEQTGAIKDQTEAIKEQTETNKNIFERIGEVLSYLNPFSENFFVYKLIELLLEAIKSLFIPSDDFFSNYFTNLKQWFSDRLGFLFYPFELILDLLDKIVNINFSDPVLNIPDINEPFTGTKLISATKFNLNDLLSNSIFNTVHEIYFVGVDALIIIGLVNLAKRKWEGVSNK